MLTNCLAACAHLTVTVSETERDIGRKSSFFRTPLAFDAPVSGFPSEQRHPVRYGKTKMAWLADGEKISKISLFVLAQLTNVTDGRTDRQTDRHRMPAIAALMQIKNKINDSIARQKSRFATNIWLYLGTDARQSHSYYGRRIGIRTQAFELFHFE